MDKKERILSVALSMFADKGFHATPTSKIAKEAGVSEGLIFKHFGSKKALLTALFDQVEERVGIVFYDFMMEEDPLKSVERFIEVVFQFDESEKDYWRLSFKLKWDQEFYNPETIKPILAKLTKAFTELEYEFPEIEAEMLYQNIESIAISMLRDGKASQMKFREHLRRKYLKI